MSNARFSILQARAVKDKHISDAQFRTLAALGMYADENGWCFPSLTTIGRDLGKSKQAVGRDTIALRKLGYLEVTARFDSKTKARRSSLYRLKFDITRQPEVDAPSTSEVDAPSTSEVDAPSTSEVDVNGPSNDPGNGPKIERESRASEIFKALESMSGGINTTTPGYVDTWIEKHSNEWIIKAIEEAKTRGARSIKYIDQILVGWEANGYPKSRDERVSAARGNGEHSAESPWSDLLKSESSESNGVKLLPLDDVLKNRHIAIGKCSDCEKKNIKIVTIKDGSLCFECFDIWRKNQLGIKSHVTSD